ncbi:hypothetical protein A3D88_04610 [Candidatus Peribacteria bacterium RIFCSPHIGHO2_02_FULL_52_16]|nr:MAG: hypothetical protein A2706_03240 [Candidatus Peribacteria bacterium RIFCSPHIGHO2_01_FULL_51_35]OGJ60887.1 MAG: hypothetical protein A3D88_04610 [Candidatus Peribacteria bacterium RIFCSPHIGHO2_02_FULL_52_16]
MDNADIQKKCTEFLNALGVPGFIVFGWQKPDEQFGFVYSNHKMPVPVVIKGMTFVLSDFVNKKL